MTLNSPPARLRPRVLTAIALGVAGWVLAILGLISQPLLVNMLSSANLRRALLVVVVFVGPALVLLLARRISPPMRRYVLPLWISVSLVNWLAWRSSNHLAYIEAIPGQQLLPFLWFGAVIATTLVVSYAVDGWSRYRESH